ncbi:UNVERIFIED_CONTAM: hypothetical protein FKN15_076301 [Acipenser sinensis]
MAGVVLFCIPQMALCVRGLLASDGNTRGLVNHSTEGSTYRWRCVPVVCLPAMAKQSHGEYQSYGTTFM